MKVLCILISIFLLFSFNSAFAGKETTFWYKTFGYGVGYSVQETSDGNYMIAGYTKPYGAVNEDIWLIKTNTSGEELWNRTIGTYESEVAYSIQQTNDSGYIIAGSREDSYYGDDDMLVVKVDSEGLEEWERLFSGWATYVEFNDFPTEDGANSVKQTTDNEYVIAGSSVWWCYPDDYIWSSEVLIKLDENGNKQWGTPMSWYYPECCYDTTTSVVVDLTPVGNYVFAGYSNCYPPYDCQIWLFKTPDQNHDNFVWEKTYGGVGDDIAKCIQQTSDGGYVVTGYRNFSEYDDYDIFLLKVDAEGNQEWLQNYGGPDDDYGREVQQTPDNGYIVVGYTKSYGSGNADALLIKVNSSGDLEWSETFGGTGNDYAYSIDQTSSGGYIITGTTASYGTSWELWLIYYKYTEPLEAPFSNTEKIAFIALIILLVGVNFLVRKRHFLR